MAFARHNIEKRRLIELVRLNPILWDCRLPHYKRSDKKKALKWNELGRIFNVNGERVQRTFTSLREIFRRELNHEKMLGTRFKSKWEYYEEMAFLKEVIRERKSRERAKSGDVTPQNFTVSNNNNNNSHVIDEYQYFAPNDPNNPHNQQIQQQQQQLQQQSMNSSLTQQQQQQQQQQHLKQLPLIPTTINNSISLNLPIPPVLTTIPSQPSGPLHLPTDMLMNLNANALAALQKFTHTNGNTVRPPSRARSLIMRSCSSSPSIYIKEEEADSLDDTISLDTITAQEKSIIEQRNKMIEKNPTTSTTKPLNNKESNSISHSANLHTNTTKNKNNTLQNLIIDEEQIDVSDLDDDPDVDMIEDDERLSIATAIISLNKRPAPKEPTTTYAQHHRSSPREILYTKFGEFLAARLNTLNETIANELMNKILMLIAEK